MLLVITVRRGPSRFRLSRANPLESLLSRFCVAVPVAVRRGSSKCLICLPSRFRLGSCAQTPHTPPTRGRAREGTPLLGEGRPPGNQNGKEGKAPALEAPEGGPANR